jgi:uncharacterized Zn finger protein (UPF0148 family)
MDNEPRKKIIKEITAISQKVEDTLWELTEKIQSNPNIPSEELDSIIDGYRDQLILPIAQFVRRSDVDLH